MSQQKSPPQYMPKNHQKPQAIGFTVALKIIAIYAVAAALWIYASDTLLAQFVTDPAVFSKFSIWKGLFFVVVTSLILFIAIRGAVEALLADQCAPITEAGSSPGLRHSPIVPIISFVLLTSLILIGSFTVFNRFEANTRNAIESQMGAIAALKTQQIEALLGERRDDALALASNSMIVKWLARGAKQDEDARDISLWLNSLLRISDYRGICILDREGKIREMVGDAESPMISLAIRSMTSGKVLYSDIHSHGVDSARRPEIDMVAPLFSGSRAGGKALGAVYLSIDPAQKLYPLIQMRPTPSLSAETLLVRREGNDVLYLNDLRHRQNTALTLRFPVSTPQLAAAMAIRGVTGAVEGSDYRGVPCIAYIAPVKGTSWFIVAKVDSSEVLAPIDRLRRMTALLTIVFTMVSGAVIFLWWRQQQIRFLAVYYRNELERASLADQLDILSRNANDIILLIDEEERIIDANARAIEAYGYPRDRLIGMAISALRESPTQTDFADYRCQLSAGRGVRFEAVHLRSDGSTFPVEVSSSNFESKGQIFRQSIIRDITERKKAEEELRASREQLNAIFVSSPVAIVVMAVDGTVTLWNPTAERTFGWSADEAVGRILPIVPAEKSEEFRLLRERVALGDSWAGMELRRQRKDGSPIDVSLSTAPLCGADGTITGIMSVMADITEHRRLEAQLQHTQKMEALGTLAGGVAHDFNNILTAIIGYANLIQMKMAVDDPLRSKTDQILAAAERASVLTHGLLAYSRKEAMDLRPVDLNMIIRNVDRFLSRIIGEDVDLTIVPGDGALKILADVSQVEQVLMNLATNARDAMPNGGTIRIAAMKTEIDKGFIATHGYGTEGAYALITVSDTGSGMDETTRMRIFEPFFTTKDVGKGTGLGLAIVYGIIKQHKGFINVYSEPGKGTTFRVYLPLTDISASTNGRESRLPACGRGETILIIEDNKQIRGFLMELLPEHGYRVIEAADGEEGVRLFRERSNEIDLILTDVIMPHKNGRETYDEVRMIRPGVKALFMSGYTADIISRKGIDATGLNFVPKPLSTLALLEKIHDVLSR